jgi:hypothetical protein
MAHDLVACGRIGGTADVAAQSSYKAHGVTESSGFVDSFFFA